MANWRGKCGSERHTTIGQVRIIEPKACMPPQIWSLEERFRKPFPLSYSSPLRLTQAHFSQGLRETRTLAGIGWGEVESSTK
jgi:hypothetical protein